MNKKYVWGILKELNSTCYICKKNISLFCGQPEIKMGGCCVGYWFKGIKWITPRYAHIHCYLKVKGDTKTFETEKQTIKMLIYIFKKRLDFEEHTLKKEPLCKGKWRKEIKLGFNKNKRVLNYLKRVKRC